MAKEKKSEYRKGNTKLFNIRVHEFLHSEFKKCAQAQGVSMANLLLGYMERVVDGTEEAMIKSKENIEFDPLTNIRGQYEQGKDF